MDERQQSIRMVAHGPWRIVLASASPRRRELMDGLDIDYVVRVPEDVDESYPSSLTGEEVPLYISKKKAEACLRDMAPDEVVITADTIVYDGHEALGKPKDRAEAVAMLRHLSGRDHQVITGVSLTTSNASRSFVSVTRVWFDTLSDEEIEYYVERYKPYDKAGAYGIQEWIGFVGVSRIEGSYFNVMGLPVQRLYRELKQLTIKN